MTVRVSDLVNRNLPEGKYIFRVLGVESKETGTGDPMLRFSIAVASGPPEVEPGRKHSYVRMLTGNMLWKIGEDLASIGCLDAELPDPTNAPEFAREVGRLFADKLVQAEVKNTLSKKSDKVYNDINITGIATFDGATSAGV